MQHCRKYRKDPKSQYLTSNYHAIAKALVSSLDSLVINSVCKGFLCQSGAFRERQSNLLPFPLQSFGTWDTVLMGKLNLLQAYRRWYNNPRFAWYPFSTTEKASDRVPCGWSKHRRCVCGYRPAEWYMNCWSASDGLDEHQCNHSW